MGRQDMGWEGPAHRRPRRLEPLMAVAVSVLICGPGKWDGWDGGLWRIPGAEGQ